jgi:class 3 adenylate cyclase
LWRSSATIPPTTFSADTAHVISTQVNGTTSLLEALQAATAAELDAWTTRTDFNPAVAPAGDTWHDRWFRLLHSVALPVARLCGLVSVRLADNAALSLISRPFDYPAYLWGGYPLDASSAAFTDERTVGLWPNGTRVPASRSNPFPATTGVLNLTNVYGMRWRQTAAIAQGMNYSLNQLVARTAAESAIIATYAGKTQLLLGAGYFGAQPPVAPAAPRGLITPTTFSYSVAAGAIVPKISIPFYVPLLNASRVMVGLVSCAISMNDALVPLLSRGATAVGPGTRLFLVDADGFIVADSTGDFFTLRASDDLVLRPVLASEQRCVAVPDSRLTACLSHYTAFASVPMLAVAAASDVLSRSSVALILRRHHESVVFSSAPISTAWAALSTTSTMSAYHPTNTPVFHVVGVRPVSRIDLSAGYRAVNILVPIACFALSMVVASWWAHSISSALRCLVDRAATPLPGAPSAVAQPAPKSVSPAKDSHGGSWGYGQAAEVLALDGILTALLKSLSFADSFVPDSLKLAARSEVSHPRSSTRPSSKPAGTMGRSRRRSPAVPSINMRGASGGSHEDLSVPDGPDSPEMDETFVADDTEDAGSGGYYYGVRQSVPSPGTAGLVPIGGGAGAGVQGIVMGSPTLGAVPPANGDDLRVLSEARAVSVAALNVVGFQAAALGMSTLQVGEFLRSLTCHVQRYARNFGGELDSYHGDHFMLTFNAARPCGRHSVRAVACAVGLAQRAGAALFAAQGQGRDGMYITAGVATAMARCGVIGNDQARRATVLGNAVPRAVAVEAAIRHHPREARWRATFNGRFRIGVPEDLLNHLSGLFYYECVDVVALPNASSAASFGGSSPSAGALPSSTRPNRSASSYAGDAPGSMMGPSQRVHAAIAQIIGHALPSGPNLATPYQPQAHRASNVSFSTAGSESAQSPTTPLDAALPLPRIIRMAAVPLDAVASGVAVGASTPRVGATSVTTADGEPATNMPKPFGQSPTEHGPSAIPLVDGYPGLSPGMHGLSLPAAAAPSHTNGGVARAPSLGRLPPKGTTTGTHGAHHLANQAALRDANRIVLLAAAVRRGRALGHSPQDGVAAVHVSPMKPRQRDTRGGGSRGSTTGAALLPPSASSNSLNQNLRSGANPHGSPLHTAARGSVTQLQEQLESELAAWQSQQQVAASGSALAPSSPLVSAANGGRVTMNGSSGGDVWTATSAAAVANSSGAAVAGATAAPVGQMHDDEFSKFIRAVSYGSNDVGPGASWRFEHQA